MLNLESKSRRLSGMNKVFLAVVAIFLLFKGSTFAANITINTNNSLEYGQGVTALTACSGSTSLNLLPINSFSNGSGSDGQFRFSSLEVSNIPSSCNGSKFILSAFDSSTGTALALYNSSQTKITVIKKSDNTFQLGAGQEGINLVTNSSSSFTVTFTTPVASANSIYKLTIQSANAACSDGFNCAIGDTGPGGGIIFALPGTSGNTTGLTFEVAASDLPGTYAMCSVVSVSGLALNNAFGFGETNTAILNNDSNCNGSAYASYNASRFNGGGYSDWFLPSANELKMVKDNAISSFPNRTLNYLSSSQNSANSIWFVNFGDTSMCGGGYWPLCTSYKNDAGLSVRPVRSF